MSRLPNTKAPCKNCPFRKDTLRCWLGSDRMTEILESQSFVCHKKTDLQCAGHMLFNGQKNDFVRLAARLGIELDLSGKELVFDNAEECIQHHRS